MGINHPLELLPSLQGGTVMLLSLSGSPVVF